MIKIQETEITKRGRIIEYNYFINKIDFNLFKRFVTSKIEGDDTDVYVNYDLNNNIINVCRVDEGMITFHKYRMYYDAEYDENKDILWTPDMSIFLETGKWFNSIDELYFKLEDKVGNIDILYNV